ncbi:MAG: hypothetical protein ACLQLO_20670 [Mycobacterium sp.]
MQFVALLIGVALVVKYWWLIAAVVGMFCAVHYHTDQVEFAVPRHAHLPES